jgi:hypothetical protein
MNYKLYFLVTCAIIISTQSKSQTTLVAGDIAFTGYVASYNAPTPDEFSFVLLKNITAGTVINFTDNGWLSTNAFRSGEQTITWTSNAALLAGREIRIAGTTATLAGGGSAGTVTGTALSLSVNGDQVLAYQGTVASPTFISGIHMNVYSTTIGDPVTTTAAAWDGTANTTNSSALPPGLSTATNAIWVGTQGVPSSERNNGRFNCSSGNITTVATTRASVNNQAFWTTEFAASGTPPAFSMPTGCNYLGSTLPVKLISFSASVVINDVELKWKTAEDSNLSHYEVQRSVNGSDFISVTNVPAIANGGQNNYTYIDGPGTAFDLLYYRLKSVDLDGSFSYFGIVRVFKKGNVKDLAIDYIVNPFKQIIQLQLSSNKTQKIQIRLLTGEGQIVIKKEFTVVKGSTAVTLTAPVVGKGIYLVDILNENGDRQLRKVMKE